MTEYIRKIRLFSPNARLYLVTTLLNGLGFGVYRLLFNFYILSLGYGETFLGTLITVGNGTALLAALPAGYLADLLGRKRSLLLAGGTMVVSSAGIILWRDPLGFILMGVLSGLGQSLFGVTGAPFLMENSGDEERGYLFSFNMGGQMVAGFVGNWLGGHLPTWVGGIAGVSAVSAAAYGGSMAVVVLLGLLSLLPLARRRPGQSGRPAQSPLAPLIYARKHPRLLIRLISPMWVTALGAALLMPFVNVFYRQTYARTDAAIGTLFAAGSLAMGLGLLAAPPIADRTGKIQLVIISQAVSIPFLLLMGFVPWFWLSAAAYLIRLVLMNMSGPIYQAFLMEQVEPEARATVASLVSMSWNFGWTFSPQVSGLLQERYGFGPVFAGTTILYIIAILMYHRFWMGRANRQADE